MRDATSLESLSGAALLPHLTRWRSSASRCSATGPISTTATWATNASTWTRTRNRRCRIPGAASADVPVAAAGDDMKVAVAKYRSANRAISRRSRPSRRPCGGSPGRAVRASLWPRSSRCAARGWRCTRGSRAVRDGQAPAAGAELHRYRGGRDPGAGRLPGTCGRSRLGGACRWCMTDGLRARCPCAPRLDGLCLPWGMQ